MSVLPHKKNSKDSTPIHEQRLRNVWQYTQRGLVYPAPHAIFATFWLKKDTVVTRAQLKALVTTVRDRIHSTPNLGSANTTAILGVSPARWRSLSAAAGLPLPKGLTFAFPKDRSATASHSAVMSRTNGSFVDSEGDLWFHIKSDKASACDDVLAIIKDLLLPHIVDCVAQSAASKSHDEEPHGKVLGCRFSENLNNPSDPLTIAKHCLTGVDDAPVHLGSSFVIAQRFRINWDQLKTMSEDQIEDIIGRKTDDTIIPDRDTRSHIKSSRLQDAEGNTTPVLRLGLPFGQAKTSNAAKCPFNATVSDEQGIYFAGFTKSFAILENIVQSQTGAIEGFMNDRLFNNVRSDLGGFFYIPSLGDLDIAPETMSGSLLLMLNANMWSNFPGVDWSRLDRHYREASPNGFMFYNHKNYLFTMTTMGEAERAVFSPPSARVLSLLENSFSRWQDCWYVDRKQQEITEDLSFYMRAFGLGGDGVTADNIYDQSVMVRKGWAIRATLHLLSSDEYGFRGRRVRMPDGSLVPYCGHADDGPCKVVQGADTFRISPEEIIVGGMPNLSLGEGRYVMKYLTAAERTDGFLVGLSEASGVGHVIPNFEKAVELGIDGMIANINTLEAKAVAAVRAKFATGGKKGGGAVRDQAALDAAIKSKADFYESCRLSLAGVSEYCDRYAALARQKSAEMSAASSAAAGGLAWEAANLLEIGTRMAKLAHAAPTSFVEAVQLIFTLHTCLHLNGEPTAMGRLDQILFPFYAKDLQKKAIDAATAQEIIDAMYIKMDEKVQQNRLFMEDHQPFGNLAMGGSSGPYPQGASLGQWVQQMTVGGSIADGSANPPHACNALTTMFIRASRRLPLNAPTLSLRTHRDMPQEVLKEAAMSLLSGGAHPLLLNDEKLIEGLVKSGDGVGGATIAINSKSNANDNTNSEAPIPWKSSVSLKSAQNYACDGCYEPQFPGENWFCLGGFSTLQPLECAINKGRTYSSAGPAYLCGQTVSMTTADPSEIPSWEVFYQLYFDHFEYLNRKAINGQLMSYGANTAFCPAPLLNVLMDGCLEKGQDYYSGGTIYNVYGPCYIALSSAINSLYAVKKLVFDPKTAVMTLAELRDCLCCDWGYKMVEPFVSSLAGPARTTALADRFQRNRQIAMRLPKYGRGNAEVDALGNEVVARIAEIATKTFTDPLPQTQATMKRLAQQFGTAEFPFGFQIQPGVGTFENHVEMGAWNGASADGRRMGTTVASDLSAAPSHADLPIDHQLASFNASLAGFTGNGVNSMTEGAPTDFNINEDFPLNDLTAVLQNFAKGSGSNILTVTVANPNTFAAARGDPEGYDLLRVRTGGWSNFFTSVFPSSQDQHQRRPVSTTDAVAAEAAHPRSLAPARAVAVNNRSASIRASPATSAGAKRSREE